MAVRGVTVLVDFFASPRFLQDKSLISDFLFSVVEKCGLTPVKESLVVKEFPIGDMVGLSGTVILIESHCGIHTWPEYSYAHFELSSCRPIDDGIVTLEISRAFCGARILDCKVMEWGCNF